MDDLLAAITALVGLVSTLAAARTSAKQSDLQALRDTIAALEAENACLRDAVVGAGLPRPSTLPAGANSKR